MRRIYHYRGHAIGVQLDPSPLPSWTTKHRWQVYVDEQLCCATDSPWRAAQEHIDSLENSFTGTLEELFELLKTLKTNQ
jgi:hypothetical protein